MNPQDHHNDAVHEAARNRAEDRLLETSLAELFGAESAPDMSREILEHHERRKSITSVDPGSRRNNSQGSRFVGLMAATLLLSLTLLLWLRPQAQLQAAELHLRILRGNLTLRSDRDDAGRTTIGPGAHVLWIRPGDHLSTGSLDTSFEIETWGQMQLDPYTTLEFKNLETLTMNGKTITTSILLGVLAGTGTWYGLTETVVAKADDSITVGSQEEKEVLTARFEKRERELLAENRRLKNKILELETANNRKEVLVTETGKEPSEEKPVAMKIEAPAFTTQEYAEVLAEVDWQAMGDSMKDMLPLLSELMEEWEKTGEPSLELAGKIQALNGKLLQQLPALTKGGIPGSGPNGVFTHPLVVSNQVDAFLKAAGIPLNKNQAARLAALSLAYTTEDEVQRLTSSKDDLRLAGVLAETEVKARFYEDLRGVLSKDQIAKLYPKALEGLTQGDLFSTGLVWAQYAKPVRASGPAEFQKRISGSITSSLRLDSAQQKKLDGVLSQWAREFPSSIWKNKAGFHERNQRFRIQDVRKNAKRQMALMRKLTHDLGLTPEQRKRLLESRAVFMPVSTR